MLNYDNIEDVRTKLVGTLCYYDGKACLIKAAEEGVDDKDKQLFTLTFVFMGARTVKLVRLDDPLLNYMNFNIGYANFNAGPVWYYRVPQKQYRQGLKYDQMSYLTPSIAYAHGSEFGWNHPCIAMMENRYPSFHDALQIVKTEKECVAFHRNLAIRWDAIHKDLILAYKGKNIGSMVNRDNVLLLDEYRHLQEAVKEALA